MKLERIAMLITFNIGNPFRVEFNSIGHDSHNAMRPVLFQDVVKREEVSEE